MTVAPVDSGIKFDCYYAKLVIDIDGVCEKPAEFAAWSLVSNPRLYYNIWYYALVASVKNQQSLQPDPWWAIPINK